MEKRKTYFLDLGCEMSRICVQWPEQTRENALLVSTLCPDDFYSPYNTLSVACTDAELMLLTRLSQLGDFLATAILFRSIGLKVPRLYYQPSTCPFTLFACGTYEFYFGDRNEAYGYWAQCIKLLNDVPESDMTLDMKAILTSVHHNAKERLAEIQHIPRARIELLILNKDGVGLQQIHNSARAQHHAGIFLYHKHKVEDSKQCLINAMHLGFADAFHTLFSLHPECATDEVLLKQFMHLQRAIITLGNIYWAKGDRQLAKETFEKADIQHRVPVMLDLELMTQEEAQMLLDKLHVTVQACTQGAPPE